jgi:hypothetical protein
MDLWISIAEVTTASVHLALGRDPSIERAVAETPVSVTRVNRSASDFG